MKSCPVCHLLNNDEDTKCGNCGTPLSSREGYLYNDGGERNQSGFYKQFYIPALGLLNGGLLIAALVRGTFLWEMLLTLLLQAMGTMHLFFPDVMFKLTYGLMIREGDKARPGDYYYFQAKFRGFAFLISGIVILMFVTFRNI